MTTPSKDSPVSVHESRQTTRSLTTALVVAVERTPVSRLAGLWVLHVLSKAYGLQPSSGDDRRRRAGRDRGLPARLVRSGVTFGQDPNDLTERPRPLTQRLPAHAPDHDVCRRATHGLVLAANLQYLSGKPWAKTALINPNESARPVMIEPRGSQRLSSQSLLDLRVSRAFGFGGIGRVELCLDVLNALNDTAEESLRNRMSYNAIDRRSAQYPHRSAPRDDQRQAQSRPVASYLTNPICVVRVIHGSGRRPFKFQHALHASQIGGTL